MIIKKNHKIILNNSIDYFDQDTIFSLALIYKIKFNEVVCCQNLFCFYNHPMLLKEIDLNLSFIKLIHFVIFNSIIICLFYPCVIVFFFWCKILRWFCYLIKDDRTFLKYENICLDIGTLLSKEPFLNICDCKKKTHFYAFRWFPIIKEKIIKKLN